MLGLAVALAGASSVADEALDEVSTFDIEPQPLADALLEFSQQADIQIVMVSATVKDIDAGGIVGERTNREALELLLDDQALRYMQHDDRTVSIQTDAVTEDSASGKYQPTSSSALSSLAQTSAPQKQETPISQTNSNTRDTGQSIPLDEIIVTGTNIRGIAPESSPVRTFDRDDILNSGAGTAQSFIQILPLNFGGGSNANVLAGLPNDDSSSFNGSFGSSVNLRGLGSGSTLVLLNGRRLAPSSGIGDFVDISLIPASAIDRVEVLTDGASAIYGADAVAGVVNFVLRDDYDGAEASFRYGTVTDGELDEYRASFTGGKNWDSGNALVVYEYFNQGNLSTADREFSQDAPLPNDLLPDQKRHSILASARQGLSPDFEVFGDIFYSERDAERNAFSIFATDPQPFQNSPSTESLSFSAGGTWQISETWYTDFTGLYSQVYSESRTTGFLPSRRETDSKIYTTDAKASGDVFQLPGGDTKLAIGGHFRTESFENKLLESMTGTPGVIAEFDRDVYAVFAEAFIPIIGPENAVPGFQRLELNVSGRFEDYSDFRSTIDPKIGVLWSPVDALKFRGSYSTSFNPPPLGRVGASDFDAQLAPTSLLNFIFGLTPGDPSIADVPLLIVGGTAKGLEPEESRAFTGGVDYNGQWDRHRFDLSVTYFNIDFDNRLGTTPIPGNTSAFDAHNVAFNSPELFPEGAINFSPSKSEIRQLLDSVDNFLPFPGIDPLDTQIINNVLVVRNLSRTVVKGVDLDVAYTYETNVGSFTVGIDGTYLADFQQQAASTTPLVEQIDTLFNPVALKFRAKVVFSRDGFAANLFANYADDYQVDSSVDSMKVDSWSTVDLSLSYSTRDRINSAVLSNMTFRFSVSNLFDENPPVAPSNPQLFIFGYDPANADPRNRFVAFELIKSF